MEELTFLSDINPDELKIGSRKGAFVPVSKRQKKEMKKKSSKADITDIEDQPRPAFTAGWNDALNLEETLPIKVAGGKVIRPLRATEEQDDSDDESIDEEEQPEQETKPLHSDDEDIIVPEEIKAPKVLVVNTKNVQEKKAHIAELCHAITTDPESAFKKIKDETNHKKTHKINELFNYLRDGDGVVVEVAMLSALLIFKDICPSYRIRPLEEQDKDVQLKKETKKLRDYEQSLLLSYQIYVKFLDSCVRSHLGSDAHVKISSTTPLGISALRCQCELLRFLPHFNFRTNLLTSVVNRAAQSYATTSSLCCDTITQLFVQDKDGEISFEIIQLISQTLVTYKYHISMSLLKTLTAVKLTVHADQASSLKKKVKQDKRKRKRSADDVEAGLLEAEISTSAAISKRFQANSLHEVCLIYFRIIKKKVGFQLLPTALEGLSRITHLVNIDTVNDLITLLRTLVESSPPLDIQVLSIYCVLRTLGGPGSELQVDDEVFLSHLQQIIYEIPANYAQWNLILECIEEAYIKKKEKRNKFVIDMISALFISVPHVPVNTGTSILATIHNVLLRYPLLRSELELFQLRKQMDDDVADLAMMALRPQAEHEKLASDGSYIITLLQKHKNVKLHSIIGPMTQREIKPVHMRLSDATAAANSAESFIAAIDKCFHTIPSTIGTTSLSKQKAQKSNNSSKSRQEKSKFVQKSNKNRKSKPHNNNKRK